MKNQFTIGIVGAGLIAREHAVTLVRNKRVAGLHVFDADQARAQAFAADFGAVAFDSLSGLVDSCDLVWVCTPPMVRLDPILACCKARKPVFCEKPLALTGTDAIKTRDAVKRAGIPFFMGQSGRFTPVFAKIKALVDQGLIGDPLWVWSNRHGYLDPKTAPPWRLDDKTSGGVVVEFGIHEIDFCQWIAGPLQSIHAVGTSRVINPGKFTEAVSASGITRSGVAARIDVSWANPRYLWQRGVEGTKGSLFYDDSAFNIVQHHAPGKKPRLIKAGTADWKDPKTGENLTFRHQAKAVLDALADGAPPPVTLQDGLLAFNAAKAMMQSVKSHRPINL